MITTQHLGIQLIEIRQLWRPERRLCENRLGKSLAHRPRDSGCVHPDRCWHTDQPDSGGQRCCNAAVRPHQCAGEAKRFAAAFHARVHSHK